MLSFIIEGAYLETQDYMTYAGYDYKQYDAEKRAFFYENKPVAYLIGDRVFIVDIEEFVRFMFALLGGNKMRDVIIRSGGEIEGEV